MVNKIFNDIKLIVYDYDGVMTNNKEFIAFNLIEEEEKKIIEMIESRNTFKIQH
jgi:hypothetical protein